MSNVGEDRFLWLSAAIFVLSSLNVQSSSASSFSTYGQCPQPMLVFPCRCDDRTVTIVCEDIGQPSLLKSVFQRISRSSDFDRTKFAANLIARNLDIKNLDEGAFGDVPFEKITLNSTNLTTIHENAFTFTNFYTTELFIDHSKLTWASAGAKGPFAIASKMPFLEQFSMSYGHVSVIPNEAFSSPSNGIQSKLRLINLRGNVISFIGNKAFAALPALQELDLRENRISSISPSSLSFDLPTDLLISIYLWNNSLYEHSLTTTSLLAFRRPVALDLDHNKIGTVKELEFSSFLNVNPQNRVSFNGNPLRCDCSLKWLFEEEFVYRSRVAGLFCPDSSSLWEASYGPFKACVKN